MKKRVIAALIGSLIFGIIFITVATIFRAINISRSAIGEHTNLLLEGLIVSAIFFVIIVLFLKFGRKRNL
ncbi:MAG: hypothetical protein ABIR31_01195 [Ginsengibacter sp.]